MEMLELTSVLGVHAIDISVPLLAEVLVEERCEALMSSGGRQRGVLRERGATGTRCGIRYWRWVRISSRHASSS
jgi:hypothetical protein